MRFLGVFLFKFTRLYVGLRQSLIHLLSHSLHAVDASRFPALAEAWLIWKNVSFGKTLLCLVWYEPDSSDHSSSNMRSPLLKDFSFSNCLPTPREGSSEFLQGASATAFGFSLIPRLAAFALFRDSADIPFHYLLQNSVLGAHQCPSPCPHRLSVSSWAPSEDPSPCPVPVTFGLTPLTHLSQLLQNPVNKSSTTGLCFTDVQVITQECWHLHITDLGVKLAGCQKKSSNPLGTWCFSS